MKKKFKVLISISVVFVAIIILFVGYNIKKTKYEPVAYSDHLIAEIKDISTKNIKGTDEKDVNITLNIKNISDEYDSDFYIFNLLNENTDSAFIPSDKAECVIKANQLNKKDVGVYGDPIFAKTECELFINYKVPKDEKLEDLVLSLWDLSYKSLYITEEDPVLIDLK
ncbi:hypothetical protein FKF97_16485 [Clostridium perfringens]|nr:hypothetical protein [Clostridium perfringens]